MAAFLEVCQATGVRVTHQRMEIYRELASTEEHPSAETICRRVRERMPTVSVDTIYRTLWLLEKSKLISRVHILTETARFDANTGPHHHFICSRCGLINDFYSSEPDQFQIPTEVQSWGEVESIHLELRGVCTNCATTEQ
jgi:Fur family peroxide stress response transcriptional regulator